MLLGSILGSMTLLMALAMICTTGLIGAFMFAVNQKDGKLGAMLEACGPWAIALICAAYALSPIDAIPEIVVGPFPGLLDDLAVIFAGVIAARQAWKRQEEAQQSQRRAA